MDELHPTMLTIEKSMPKLLLKGFNRCLHQKGFAELLARQRVALSRTWQYVSK